MDLEINGKNVYVISDIHNDATGFREMLNRIGFLHEDFLIIDGDIFDRGEEPVDLYFEILKHPNIQVVQGNHDVWIAREILEKYDNQKVGQYIRYNSLPILEERLTPVDLVNLASWIKAQPFYINLTLDGIKYQIAHAQTYKTPERMWDKSKLYMGDAYYESFIRGMEEHDDFISIVGHTATEDRRIWKSPSGQTIRIDCGNGYKPYHGEGYLAALRLNDMAEYYV